jgi:hypothetical protein
MSSLGLEADMYTWPHCPQDVDGVRALLCCQTADDNGNFSECGNIFRMQARE